MLHLILFFIFAAICVGGAINLLVQKHPINSALSLIVVMGSLALHLPAAGRGVCRRRAGHRLRRRGDGAVRLRHHVAECGEEERTEHASRVAIMLGVPGLIVGLGIAAWVVSHITGLDRIAIGGPKS